MNFNIASWIMNPFVLLFLSVFTGILFGKIKFGFLSFGGSGTLFSGLIIGWWVLGYAKGFDEGDKAFAAAQSLIQAGVVDNLFFYLFLIFFVVSVGLLASKDMGKVIKNYGTKFVILAIIIPFVGASGSYFMTILSKDISPFEISGVYTGALTSSPGLAAALESAKGEAAKWAERYESLNNEDKKTFLAVLGSSERLTPQNTPTLSEEQKTLFIRSAEAGVGIGHTIGYPFGVLIVILAINFFPIIFKIDVDKEKKLFFEEMEVGKREVTRKQIKEVDFDFLGFILACLFGFTLGQIKVYLGPLGNFSLGATGGALLGSLLLGHIGKIGFINFRMNNKILGIVRELALVFFLSTVGLKYGFKVFDALLGSGAYLALVAIVVCIIALLVGFIIGRYVFKINWVILSGAICGGMTSTPGLGSCIDALDSDDPAAGYGATYPFALLSMVIFSIILHQLPI